MNRIQCFLITILLLASNAAVASHKDAGTIADHCSAQPRSHQWEYCVGYLEATIDSIELQIQSGSLPINHMCLAPNTSYDRLVDTYLNYFEKRARTLDYRPATQVIKQAMKWGFPCKH